MDTSLPTPKLDAAIEKQLSDYLEIVEKLNAHRAHPRPNVAREVEFLRFMYAHFIDSREERIQDIESAEVQEAIKIKTGLLPYGVPKLVLCVDGRVLAKLFAGLHGNALRIPAGDSKEFIPSKQDGHLVLPKHATLAKMIFKAFETADALVEVLDSHVACAARGAVEADRLARELPDKGLYYDVLRKKQMGKALLSLVSDVYGNAKMLKVIQASFDPHSGYLYAGLEQDICLKDSRVTTQGYTAEILDALAREGKILSTELFASGTPLVQEAFRQHKFDLNYETDYRHSTLQFWKAIAEMKNALSPLMIDRLKSVYPSLVDDAHAKDLEQRSILFLANAFTAFLHHDNRKYPYGEHDESIVVGTHSEKGPFARVRSFSADPDSANFADMVKFMMNLVRGNRKASRMSPVERIIFEKAYTDQHSLTIAPVPFIQFERVPKVPSDLDALQQASWSDIATIPWMTMSDEAFNRYLESKIPNITWMSAQAINMLRHRVINLYKPGYAAADALLEGWLAPLWILAGPNRETYALLPFVTSGYEV